MNTAVPADRPLVLIQRAPYGDSLSRAALDVAMSFSVFAQAPAVLFAGDGVRCLTATQSPDGLGRKSLRKVIDSLPLYDVDTVYVERSSWQKLGTNTATLPDGAVLLDDESAARLCVGASAILSF